MADVYYSSANVAFPEHFERNVSWEFKENAGSIANDNVTFTRDGYQIDAKLWRVSIPYTMSDNPDIQENIVQPAIEIIVADIETVEDLFDDLRELTRKDQINSKLYYQRDAVTGKYFRVYDYSIVTSLDNRPSQKLMNFKKLPKHLLDKKYKEFYEMAEFVDQEEGSNQIPYVKGRSLREAIERALEIYNMTERLESINFQK